MTVDNEAARATGLSRNALQVLEARYLRRDQNGRISEAPDQLFERVARAISEAELLYGPASQALVVRQSAKPSTHP